MEELLATCGGVHILFYWVCEPVLSKGDTSISVVLLIDNLSGIYSCVFTTENKPGGDPGGPSVQSSTFVNILPTSFAKSYSGAEAQRYLSCKLLYTASSLQMSLIW